MSIIVFMAEYENAIAGTYGLISAGTLNDSTVSHYGSYTGVFRMGGDWFSSAVAANSTYDTLSGYPQTFWVFCVDDGFTKAVQVKATLTNAGVLFSQVPNMQYYWKGDVRSNFNGSVKPDGGIRTTAESCYSFSYQDAKTTPIIGGQVNFTMKGDWIGNNSLNVNSGYNPLDSRSQKFWVYCFEDGFTKAVQVKSTQSIAGVSFVQVPQSAYYWRGDITNMFKNLNIPSNGDLTILSGATHAGGHYVLDYSISILASKIASSAPASGMSSNTTVPNPSSISSTPLVIPN